MSQAQNIARIAFGATMIGAGVLHLTVFRREFQKLVPDEFPIDKDATVVGSGVVEIGLGAAFIALPSKRRSMSTILVGFLTAGFIGNLDQYRKGTNAFGLDTDKKRFIRLLFQPVFVVWALFAGGRFTNRHGGAAES